MDYTNSEHAFNTWLQCHLLFFIFSKLRQTAERKASDAAYALAWQRRIETASMVEVILYVPFPFFVRHVTSFLVPLPSRQVLCL